MSNPSGLELDWMVSVDDHVLEPGHVWQDRVPAKYKHIAPHLVDNGETSAYEDKRMPAGGLGASAGRRKEDFTVNAIPTWPDCLGVVRKQIGHLPAETQYKILRGKAERLFHFIPAEPPRK